MSKFGNKGIGVGLWILLWLCIKGVNAQENAGQPSLSEFFDKLKTIEPTKEVLHYDTVSDFNFKLFVPIRAKQESKKYSYVIGLSHEKKIKSVTFLKGKEVIGIMSVFEFQTFRILTFQKKELVMSEYPDFPIFCISKESRFIVYLNREFEYGHLYKPEDVISIHILRDDFFPTWILTIRNKYIRMISELTYASGSKSVESVKAMIAFEPEKQKEALLISDQSRFVEEFYLPAADFIANLHLRSRNKEMPSWVYSRDLEFER